MKKIHLLTIASLAALSLTACTSMHESCCDKVKMNNHPVVHFEFDSDQLTLEDQKILDTLPFKLKKCPEIQIEITGYTDNTGTPEYNIELGKKRALAVRNYLVNAGVHCKEFILHSAGEKDPVQCNTTEHGRQSNRRAVILFK